MELYLVKPSDLPSPAGCSTSPFGTAALDGEGKNRIGLLE